MASNVDRYVTPAEHAVIDHTGLPGVGGGGGATVVGASVIETDVNIATGAIVTKTIPGNTLTADNQVLDVKYAWNSGSGATPSLAITFGGVTILSTGALSGSNTEGSLTIWAVRTGATTARVTVTMTENSRVNEIVQTNSITLDWSISRDLVFTFSGGMNEVHRYYQALKWPETGAIGLSGIGSDTLPIGTMVTYGGTVASIPVGFLPCDGSLADETVEVDLFAVIGTTWNVGGEPGGFFRLPDLRGKSIVGLNDGSLPNGADGGFATRTLAALGGVEDHGHSTSTDGAHAHEFGGNFGIPTATTVVQSGAGATVASSGHLHTGDTQSVNDHGHTAASASENTMHPFAVCSYIIKSQQVGGGIGVTAQNNGGALQGSQPTLNFIPSGTIGVAVVENIGQNRIDITISASDNNDLSTYETGNALAGSIPGAAGTYSVNSSWPGTFTPHGLITVIGSIQGNDDFVSIGFCRGNLSGVASQASFFWSNGLATVSGSSGNLATRAGSTITANTPTSNNWNVSRGGAANAWGFASMSLGRATV
jgi:microcystin-dependent protein